MEEKKSSFWKGFVLAIVAMLVLGACFYAGTLVAKNDDKDKTKTEEKDKKEETKGEEKEKTLNRDDELVYKANAYLVSTGCSSYGYRFDKKSNN